MASRRCKSSGIKLWLLCLCFALLVHVTPTASAAQSEDNRAIAESLVAMLRSGMAVISSKQGTIDDPAINDKGLDGKSVLEESVRLYREETGRDPDAIDKASRHGRLLHTQMDAIVEVMNQNQSLLNAKGAGFKGFIPAVFARLVNEEFGRRAAGAAEVKSTAPPNLVRNRQARPDAWEAGIIASKFLAADWPEGKPFFAEVQIKGRPAFRMMAPQYYKESCLSCHGAPKGQLDITGYPKEGGKLSQLGAVISIVLYQYQ